MRDREEKGEIDRMEVEKERKDNDNDHTTDQNKYANDKESKAADISEREKEENRQTARQTDRQINHQIQITCANGTPLQEISLKNREAGRGNNPEQITEEGKNAKLISLMESCSLMRESMTACVYARVSVYLRGCVYTSAYKAVLSITCAFKRVYFT